MTDLWWVKKKTPYITLKIFNLKTLKIFLQIMNNSLWQRRQSIAKFPSQTLRKPSTQQQTKLPLLNIGHFLKVEL